MATLLLIEQDAVLRGQYERALQAGFRVVAADSAQAAIDVMDDQDIRIDVIVTDVNVDKNNGIELLHELRSYDDWLAVPVILLSSVPKTRFAGIEFERYGVQDFLYKPMIRPAEVLRRVQNAVGVYETHTN